MLTPNQESYLKTLPEDRVTKVVPFDPATQATANEIIKEIKASLPLAEIFYIGSSKLGIAGENDIDLTVMANGHFESYMNAMEDLYGKPLHVNSDTKYVKWEFDRNGFPVELHLGDVMTPNLQEQIDTQAILEQDESLRKEYEQIKIKANGLPWKEYLKIKYEFWNKILGIK